MKTKHNIEKEYGKSRCRDVQYYLDGLNRNYGFPFSEKTLCEMIVDFEGFTEKDFSDSFKILDSMEFYGSIKRSHIKKACEDAKRQRIRVKQFQEVPPVPGGCPMPGNVAQKLTEIFGQKFGGNNG